MKTDEVSVANPPPEEQINWIKPSLVGEVEFMHITHDERMRAPAFKRLKLDKPIEECTWEEQIQ